MLRPSLSWLALISALCLTLCARARQSFAPVAGNRRRISFRLRKARAIIEGAIAYAAREKNTRMGVRPCWTRRERWWRGETHGGAPPARNVHFCGSQGVRLCHVSDDHARPLSELYKTTPRTGTIRNHEHVRQQGLSGRRRAVPDSGRRQAESARSAVRRIGRVSRTSGPAGPGSRLGKRCARPLRKIDAFEGGA